MIINDFQNDMKKLCQLQGCTKMDVAKRIGVTRQSFNTTLKNSLPTRKYVEAVDALGYDIEVTYIKKKERVL